MKVPRGLVADLIPFSWVDGPGNRSTVFLQGCNFDCKACHNPQTIARESVHARRMGVAELLAELRLTAPYISGVTVSGGEATEQPEFLAALFAAIKADAQLGRLTCFIDSNGSASAQTWLRMQSNYDLAQALKSESKIRVRRYRGTAVAA